MPNDNIMGIPTKACINGLTKEDTERLKNALIKQIEDSGTTVNVTEDGKIIVANDDGLFLSFDDSVIGLTKDNDDNIIAVADPYIPMDENDNPLVPDTNVIMTSGNIAVDPRIVHTTGNETIAGAKTFSNGINAYPVGWNTTSKSGMGINDYCIFAKIPSANMDNGRSIFFDVVTSSNTIPCMGRFGIKCSIANPIPLWVFKTPNGSNDPIMFESFVVLTDGTDIYLAWKKIHQYGGAMCKVALDIRYGSVQSLDSGVEFYSTADRIVTSDLSGYTVFEVVHS